MSTRWLKLWPCCLSNGESKPTPSLNDFISCAAREYGFCRTVHSDNQDLQIPSASLAVFLSIHCAENERRPSFKSFFAPRNISTSAPSTSHLIKSGAPNLRTYSSTDTASTRMVLGADLSAALLITYPNPRSGDTSASARGTKTGFDDDHSAVASIEIGAP